MFLKRKQVKFFSCLFVAAYLFSTTASAFALDVDISLGSVTVSSGEDAGYNNVSHTSSEGAVVNSISSGEQVNVIQSSTEVTSNTITVESGVQDVQITLNDVHIDTTGSSNTAAIEIQDGASATIELNGDNSLSGNTKVDRGGAAIQTDGIGDPDNYKTAEGGTVTITDVDGDGSLDATGGKKAAAIGSNGIKGGSGGVGTGVYEYGNQENYGTVIIEGGTITAKGGDSAAAIGGGNHRNGGTIVITGDANVTANGTIGAGIASSKDKFVDGDGNHVQVNGGDITISGDATVTADARSSKDAAGIGGSMYSSGGDVTITDNAVVTAIGGQRGAGIGGGYQGDGGNVVISGNATVTAQGGTKDDGNEGGKGVSGGAGIGGGGEGLVEDKDNSYYCVRGANGGSVTVSDSANVTAIGGAGAAGIGSGAVLEESKQEKAKNHNVSYGSFTGAITIDDGTTVLAFSDGTRWAMDIDEGYTVSGVTTSIMQGRFIMDIWEGRENGNDARFNIEFSDAEHNGMALLVARDTETKELIYLPINISNNAKTADIHAQSYALTVGEDGTYYIAVNDSRYEITGVASFTDYDNSGNLSNGTDPYAPFDVNAENGLRYNSKDFQHLNGAVPPIPVPTPDPDPDPDPDPLPVPVPVPVIPPAPAPVPTPVEPTGTTINDDPVPLAQGQTLIEDDEVPLVGAAQSWALYNFALMEIAVVESLALLYTYAQKADETDGDPKKLRKKLPLRIVSVLIAILSVVFFVLTENIHAALVLTDKWTIWMVAITMVQTVVMAACKKSIRTDDPSSNAPAMA